MNTFSDFLAMVQPFFDLATDLLSVPLFGVPIWRYIFSIYLFSFVALFVAKGTVNLSGAVGAVRSGSAVSKASRNKWEHVDGSEWYSNFDSKDYL